MPGIHAPDMEPDLQSVFSDFIGRSDYPTAGFTYIILHQPTNRGLSIIKGKLALHRVPEPIPGVSHPSLLEGKTNWHWECVEADNWLSFRNAATGRFLGHDADGDDRHGKNANRRSGKFRCSSTQPGPSEKFAFLSLRSGVMAPNVILSNGEVDGFEEFGPEEDEDEEGGIAERDMEEFREVDAVAAV
ncbi:hypothetical protein N0V85_004588 [Neurospora sp. IMI 360204]|nr:hypothetical protein N0V85_004588 [Neurospora sp. IMI 360204]